MAGLIPDGDTALGGRGRDFPSTCWSRFVGAFSAGGDGGKAAVETLARSYWKPIYAYIRASWAKSNEDAKDLTQGFFAWMLESGFLAKADPSRGRFRAFVKVALKHYLGKEVRDGKRLKRGGDHPVLSLDFVTDHAAALEIPDPAGRAPDDLLDETWKDELVARAEQLLKQELVRVGRDSTFRIFRDYYLNDEQELDYKAVADRYGTAQEEVFNHLRFAKKRFRLILRDLVSETVESEADLAAEWAALFREEKE